MSNDFSMAAKEVLEKRYIDLLKDCITNVRSYSPDKMITNLTAAIYTHRKAHELIENEPDVDVEKYPVKHALEDEAVVILRKLVDKIRNNECNTDEIIECINKAIFMYDKAHELVGLPVEDDNKKDDELKTNDSEIKNEDDKQINNNQKKEVITMTETTKKLKLLKAKLLLEAVDTLDGIDALEYKSGDGIEIEEKPEDANEYPDDASGGEGEEIDFEELKDIIGDDEEAIAIMTDDEDSVTIDFEG